jgi:pilus assembly protein Flp/PilA
MFTSFIQFADDESGVTGIEYGMICALIVIVIVAAVQKTGSNLEANFFGPIASGLN